jgi:hypothetical protein
MTALKALRDRGAAHLAASYPSSCMCGSIREPERKIVGAMSILLCGRCKGLTTELKF